MRVIKNFVHALHGKSIMCSPPNFRSFQTYVMHAYAISLSLCFVCDAPLSQCVHQISCSFNTLLLYSCVAKGIGKVESTLHDEVMCGKQ